jgi:hypothetical protein
MLADQLTLASNNANVLTPIMTYVVPRGRAIEADFFHRWAIYLATREEITPAGYETHAAQATAYVPVRAQKVSGSAYADAVMQSVYLKSNGTARTITAVADHVDAPTAGTITCSDETNAAHMYCYVPRAAGELIIRIKAPGAGGEIARNIVELDTRTLHEIPQRRDNKPFAFGCVLTQNFKIEILLKAAWVAYWANGATSGAVNLPYADVEIPVLESPMTAHSRAGDKYFCQGAIEEALNWIGGR